MAASPTRTAPNVSASELARLLNAYRDRRDAAALERLVELHMPLVRSLAHRHRRNRDEIDDLVQVGSIGLIHAIERWEPARGSDFAAYAVPNIAGEIKRHLRDDGPVRVPRRLQELGAEARSSERRLAAELHRVPTTSELSAAIGADENELANALASLQAGTPAELSDAVPARAGEFDASESRIDLVRALAVLDADERSIIRMRYIDAEPSERIASRVGISTRQLQRRVGQILAKLRTALEGADGEVELGRGEERPKIATMAERIEDAPAPAAEAPEPKQQAKHSGRLLVRMPQGLHGELARRADSEGVSLNGLIVGILAGAVGWHRSDQPDGGEASAGDPSAERGRRLLPVAIVANIVVLALAAAVAIALLVVILAHGIN